MRFRVMLWTLATLGLLAGSATPARAQLAVPTVSERPAATLLLPYFEVDLANPAGANTLFEINNASATAMLAHVTIWSEMHVPVHSFNVYLTGYDVQPINLRDVLSGKLPLTASAGQDPGDTPLPTDGISNQGLLSQDINFNSCAGQLPPTPLPQATVDHIRASLTGQPSPILGGLCASKNNGTQIARGYVTVDTVNNCTTKFPGEPGYFINGGVGDATNQNTLWGDYVYTNHLGGLESGDGLPLVHITADATDPELTAIGRYTFYGRVTGFSAADNREPLGLVFAARFATGANSGTSLAVWRDSKLPTAPFACNGNPPWYPLGQQQIAFFDTQENPEVIQSYPFAPQPPNVGITPFPAGTQRVRIGSADLPTVFQSGWTFLNLATVVSGTLFPIVDPSTTQAWVTVHTKGNGRYSTGWSAVQFHSARGVPGSFIPID